MIGESLRGAHLVRCIAGISVAMYVLYAYMHVCMYACMYVCTRKRFAVPTRYNNFVRNGVHIITHWEMVAATSRLGIARNKGICSALPRKPANCVYSVFTQGSVNSKSRKHLSIPDITSYAYSCMTLCRYAFTHTAHQVSDSL